jgi:6-phosphofructokinase 1
MAAFKRVSSKPYIISYTCEDIHLIANEEKRIPREWISENGFDITGELIEYMRPLVSDDENSAIPVYFAFDRSKTAEWS